MAWPTNVTDMSLAGAIKWLLLIFTVPFWMGAWQGIVRKEILAFNTKSGNHFVYGNDAVKAGLMQLAEVAVLVTLARAVWRFWESAED